MEKFYLKRPINPIVSIIAAVIIIFYSLFTANQDETLLFLALVFFAIFTLGYYKTLLHLIPFLIFLTLFFVCTAYATRKDLGAFSAFNRVFGIYLSIAISISVEPIKLVRVMRQLHISKKISLGCLVTFSFIPKLHKELKQIKLARKTRAIKRTNIKNLYRSIIFPFISRLVDISEILSLSIETRGFSLDKKHKTSIYNRVKINFETIIFIIEFIVILAFTIYLNIKGVKIFG